MTPTLDLPRIAPPSANGVHAPARPGRGRRLLHAVPTLLCFGLLAGAGWLGHATGWKMPKRAALFGEVAPMADDWCDQHNVPESVCVECDEKLLPRPAAFGWCSAHGVNECPACHPEVAQTAGSPQPLPFDPAGPLALLPRSGNNPGCDLHTRRLQFATKAAADLAGVDVDVVALRPMAEAVSGHGELGYDPTTVVRLSPRAAGTVWKVFKRVGDPVAAGEVVALVEAADVGKAKAEFVSAVVQERLAADTLLRTRRASLAGVELQTAEAGAAAARLRRETASQALTNLGLPLPPGLDAADPAGLLDKLRPLGLPAGVRDVASSNLLPVVAPQAGTATAVSVVAGEVVDPARVLVTVADPRRLWLTLHLRADEARHAAVGKAVKFRPDTGGDELAGVVSWVSPAVDDRTRTVPVRADVANPDGRLRANTFVTGRVVLRDEPRAVCVPKAAVQWEGCCHVVFVRHRDYLKPDAPKVFHVRQVRPGAGDGTHVELLAGVRPGEVVATVGSAVLRGELLRTGLGEGCACHKH